MPRIAPTGFFAVAAGVALALAFQAPVRSQSPQPAACTLERRPNTLWSLAECCARDVASNPSCRLHDAKDEYIIIKDNAPHKPDAYLIIPTAKVTGIEDSRIFEAPIVDFWAYAWDQSHRYLRQPAARTALAINSATGRTQDQLHIHISCVRPDVSRVLEAKAAQIGSYPARAVALQLPPHGNTYAAVKVTGLTGEQSPFRVIAADPGVKARMADQGVAVVGSANPDEFYVLDTHVEGANDGSAEELLDQTCKATQ